MLENTSNIAFSKIFWTNVINNISWKHLTNKVTVFWGYPNMTGRTTGNDENNYLEWYVKNVDCLPGTDGKCYSSSKLFLNTEKNIKLIGKYLPVFEGPELDPDWRSFFNFTPEPTLQDYMDLLTQISKDPTSTKTSQQEVLECLLGNFTTYNSIQLADIKNWATSNLMSDSKGKYQPINTLYVYPNGDIKDFGSSFNFAYFSSAAQRHVNFEELLNVLHIKIIRQSDFKLEKTNCKQTDSFTNELAYILPYWAKWREGEKQSGYEEMLAEVESFHQQYSYFEAEALEVTYETSVRKKVHVHLDTDNLYVVKNWKKPKVLISLCEKLCELFKCNRGLQQQLNLLLTSDPNEIKEYFDEQGIELPPDKDLPELEGEDSEFDQSDDIFIKAYQRHLKTMKHSGRRI
ncbi:hypothetical protein OKW96_11765 [Sphingobacterium sp. KU25419]|nr:hypothetical protein OKW96_11765 [Sphingobacterium sp. KU25419]